MPALIRADPFQEVEHERVRVAGGRDRVLVHRRRFPKVELDTVQEGVNGRDRRPYLIVADTGKGGAVDRGLEVRVSEAAVSQDAHRLAGRHRGSEEVLDLGSQCVRNEGGQPADREVLSLTNALGIG